MARLRIYTVHVNPALPHPYEAAEFVEEGFSWKAFIFSALWVLYHRLWWPALVIIVCNIFLFILMQSEALTHLGYFILHGSVHLLVGFYGNDWRRKKLQRLGFITADIASGDSLLRAEQRYYDRYFATHPSAPFVA